MNAAAKDYHLAHRGFGAQGAVPDEAACRAQMAALLRAARADRGLLPQVVYEVARPGLAPDSAQLINEMLVRNPGASELVRTLEFALAVMAVRSPETWLHIRRHTALSMAFFEAEYGPIGPHNAQAALTCFVAALGHDFGKIGIDRDLLHKPGVLSDHEREVMRRHDAMSRAFFEQANLPVALKDVPNLVDMDVFRGPEAQNAPKLAKLIHLTDVFEALTADRSYKEPYSVSEALNIMQKDVEKGTMDPQLFQSFLNSQLWAEHAMIHGCELGDLNRIAPMIAEARTLEALADQLVGTPEDIFTGVQEILSGRVPTEAEQMQPFEKAASWTDRAAQDRSSAEIALSGSSSRGGGV